MYVFSTSNNDIYQQGVDEVRCQVVAALTKNWNDNETIVDLANVLSEYLEQEGYL